MFPWRAQKRSSVLHGETVQSSTSYLINLPCLSSKQQTQRALLMPAASLVNLIPHLITLAGSSQALRCPGLWSRHLLLETKGLMLLFFLVANFYLWDVAKLAAGAREGYSFLLTSVWAIGGEIRNSEGSEGHCKIRERRSKNKEGKIFCHVLYCYDVGSTVWARG